ncbi:aquaporin family protein [Tessaracoccus sp. OS52]|uniref:MIP/aquaporin family protein n=1 Tax=Tessaracoccus sp. OS52 TaxID=2886691 RepID=UPI001D109F21|nr:MIP/aquaporin family protein [Tessaracoccus sp. OS52]MCC2594225.1 aquaporin family protein [Tessaracoccus sp. OS52]
MEVTLGTIFLSEVVGSALLLLLGGGVVANTLLKGSKGQNTGWLLINWGWAIGVFMGVIAAYSSGGHLNPAVTVGIIASGATEFVPGIAVSVASTLVYFAGELVGAMIGAGLMWLTYKQHFDAEEDQSKILGVFSTGPQIRNPLWNTITEIIGTFVLVFGVLAAGAFTGAQGEDGAVNLGWLGALGVALLVFGIGVSLGGPTGYAINPTRDLGPRIMHAILPIKGKGSSDWGYSWVPIVGPLIGGILGGLASMVLLP